MKIGTTSFTFRTALSDERRAPSLLSVVERCREIGLERLQVCENARPLSLSARQWERLIEQSAGLGVEIQLGCKTLSEDEIDRSLVAFTAETRRTRRKSREKRKLCVFSAFSASLR